jgi:hypothetical protein
MDADQWKARLEKALFGYTCAHTPCGFDELARQAEQLREAHDRMAHAIEAAAEHALMTNT